MYVSGSKCMSGEVNVCQVRGSKCMPKLVQRLCVFLWQ